MPTIRNNNVDNDTEAAAMHQDETSVITDDSLIVENNMTAAEKRKKLMNVYLTTDYENIVEENEFEIMKINKVIRNNIFGKIKFCRGEGNSSTVVKKGRNIRSQQMIKKLVIGRSHEFADLTKNSGFEVEVLKLCGLGADRTTITQRGQWWKTYNYHVKREIRQQRGQVQYLLRKSMTEGKQLFIFLCFE
jgi:hypothetical protein